MSEAFNPFSTPLQTGVHAIEASAGTGKTYSLTQIVARLILEQAIPIEKILVVTFTVAATAEMRERIQERLSCLRQMLQSDKTDCEDDSLRAWLDNLIQQESADTLSQRLSTALNNMDLAPIFTIDGFSVQLARTHALSLNLPPNAALLEDASALNERIVDRLWQQSMQALSQQAPLAYEVIQQAYPSPDKLKEPLAEIGLYAQFDTQYPDWEKQLQKAQTLTLPEKSERQALGARLLDLVAQHKQSLNGNKVKKATRILSTLKETGWPDWTEAENASDYLQGLAKKAFQKQWAQLLAQTLPLLQQLDDAKETLEQLSLAWFKHQHQQWKTAFETLLTQESSFTFSSLRHTIAHNLNDQLITHLQAQYAVCLIDEFQDTDPDQWRIFSTLFATDRHQLYLIGDPKQAIYGFRGANIETYYLATKTAQHHYSLNTNYRTHSKLIEGFNTLFFEEDSPHTFLDHRCLYTPVQAGIEDKKVTLSCEGKNHNILQLIQKGKDNGEYATLNHLCRDVVQLLQSGRLGEAQQPVKPGDIAILVKNHSNGEAVQRALRRLNVPSVRTTPHSVWQSDTAEALLLLMQSLLNLRNTGLLRYVLAGSLFRWPLKKLHNDTALQEAQIRFAETAAQWRKTGFLAALNTLLEEMGVWTRLAIREDGQRRMADLRHLLEQLQQAATAHQLPPQALYHWAIKSVEQGGNEDKLRLESDEDAVEIVTIHSSKGLEYPIVMVYTGWWLKYDYPKPMVTMTENGPRVHWDEEKGKETFKQAQQQEMVRLFYVACTRAKSFLGLYITTKNLNDNSFGIKHLLGSESKRRKALQTLPQWREAVAEDDRVSPWQPPVQHYHWRSFQPLPKSRLLAPRLTSYSSLARQQKHQDTLTPWQDETLGMPAPDDSTGTPLRGATYGNLFHAIMEQLPHFQADDQDIAETLKTVLLATNLKLTDTQKQQIIQQVQNTLQVDCRGFQLAALPLHAVQRELHFVLHAPRVDAERLNALMENIPGWRPIRLDKDLVKIKNFLQGFIDLVAEHSGRYYVADYKTNTLIDYTPDQLAQAMAGHDYLLQALIYQLALHRLLRNTLPGYDPDQHLGGVHYLFVRGLRPDQQTGVFSMQWNAETLNALDACFGGSHG